MHSSYGHVLRYRRIFELESTGLGTSWKSKFFRDWDVIQPPRWIRFGLDDYPPEFVGQLLGFDDAAITATRAVALAGLPAQQVPAR